MTSKTYYIRLSGHRINSFLVLCFFALLLPQSMWAQGGKNARKTEAKVYLDRSNELYYDEAKRPGVQIVKGNVALRHLNNRLTCDSAYFNQETNSFEAFGHVHMTHDNVSLRCDYAYYDGYDQMVRARYHVVLHQQGRTLTCDSLN